MGASSDDDYLFRLKYPELFDDKLRQDGRLIPTTNRVLKRILGAAAKAEDLSLPQDLEKAGQRVREMTDPYVGTTRTKFNDAAYQDPIISMALEKRQGAFFKNGYTLELKLKSLMDEEGNPLAEKAETALETEREEYKTHLKQLMDWSEKPEIDCLQIMKDALIPTIVQGRALTLITPGIEKLAPGKLPDNLIVMHNEDVGNPVLDWTTWRLLAIRLSNSDPMFLALPNQMIYIARKNYPLRKEARWFGASQLEAVLIASQAYRKVINYDFVKASVAAYFSKIMLALNVAGMAPADKQRNLTLVSDQLRKQGTDIVVVESGTEITPVPVEVDKEAMEFICNKYEELMMAAGGTTKSQMNKTEGLTRDNATIQEEVFVSYVRDPDEELIKSAFEKQLFNPLLAHLAGKSFEELPVKVVIVRQEPDVKGGGDVSYEENEEGEMEPGPGEENEPAPGQGGNELYPGPGETKPVARNPRARQQALQAKKKAEIQGKARTERPFGAAGPSLQEREVAAAEKIADALTAKHKGEKHVKAAD